MPRPTLYCFLAFALFAGIVYSSLLPTRVTLGHLAQNPRSFDGRKVILSNTGAGLAAGRYRWFPSLIGDRLPVVLILIDPFASCEGVNRYSGYCLGVCDDPIPGLPVKPPFVVILQARPVP